MYTVSKVSPKNYKNKVPTTLKVCEYLYYSWDNTYVVWPEKDQNVDYNQVSKFYVFNKNIAHIAWRIFSPLKIRHGSLHVTRLEVERSLKTDILHSYSDAWHNMKNKEVDASRLHFVPEEIRRSPSLYRLRHANQA